MILLFSLLEAEEEIMINGGSFTIIIGGAVFTGWKAYAIVTAGVTTLTGAAGLGLWNGFWKKRQ